MIELPIRDDFIKLGQALKLAGLTDTGADAKEIITEGLVKVNGETDTRRGRKLYKGDVFKYGENEIKIV